MLPSLLSPEELNTCFMIEGSLEVCTDSQKFTRL